MKVSIGRGQRMFVRTSIASQVVQYALPVYLRDVLIDPQQREPEIQGLYDHSLTFRASYPLLDLIVSQSGRQNAAQVAGANVTIDTVASAKYVQRLILCHAASPISDAALRTMNGNLRGLATPGTTPYRSVLTWVGGEIPNSAALVPAPPETIAEYLADLLGFIERDDVPEILSAALTYYQFLTIHPFKDANGRLARLLTALRSYRRQTSASRGVILAAGLSILKEGVARCFGDVFDGEIVEYLSFWRKLRSWADSVAEFSVQSLLQMHVAVRQKLDPAGWAGEYIKRVELSPIFSRTEFSSVIRGSERLAERHISALHHEKALIQREGDAGDKWVCVEARAHWDRVRHFAMSRLADWPDCGARLEHSGPEAASPAS